ncbi:nucleotidyl transferase [Mycobacterium phage Nanosmite]|nr:nucleotidyl transferase [Mycobacterium phage Nanosmite]
MSHNSDWHTAIAAENLIYKTEVGSGLHGITIPGTDDHDEMGVCIPPPECVIGTASFEQYQDRWHADGTRIPEGTRSGPGDTDQVIYSLKKYARLAAQGNPTVLLPLFVPPEKIYAMDAAGASLRENRDLFLSKQAGERFLGYLTAQRERAQGLRGRKHTNRPELVEKYGYDTKMMYHALRLAIQGAELMDYHDITLPMNRDHSGYLLAVRRGAYPLEVVLEDLRDYTENLREAIVLSSLPEAPDYEDINNWLIGLHYHHWKSKGLL